MKYDFTSILDRNGKDAIAVEHIPIPGAQVKEGFDRIPMWVADMNFPTVPTVVEAMMERVQHPAYGYFDPSEEYYASIIRWQEKRNGVTGLKPEHIGYENGVLGGVISALNVMCSKGDNVLLHSPTYIGFTMSLENNGYHIVHSPLVKDEKNVYRMDFEDMENGDFNFTIQNERVAFSPETVCPIFLYMENGHGVRGCIRINRIEPVTDELVNGVLYHRNAKVYFDLKYRKTQVNKDIF